LRKKMIILVFLMVIISPACESGVWQEFFNTGPEKAVESGDISELEKEALEYEGQMEKNISASSKLGVIYKKLGDKYLFRKAWDSAITSFEKAIGYGNNSPIVFYSLGVAYANKASDIPDRKSVEKSEFYYRKSIKGRPDFFDASYGLGILLFYKKGDREDGLKVMQNLVFRNSNYFQARFALARFQYELGNPEKSLSLYESLYADLNKLGDSSRNEEYRSNCRENIERLMRELASKR